MKKRAALVCALVMTVGLSAQHVLAGKPVDSDGDGYMSNKDCNDNDPGVWILNSCGECAPEPINGCGSEPEPVPDPDPNPHSGITGTFATPADVTAKCLECHAAEGFEAVNSLHGMKPTPAPSVLNTSGDSQKLSEINTFCSYPDPGMAGAACLGCHPTLGKYENLTAADIDCLRCHNDAYQSMYPGDPDPANHDNIVDWQGTAKTYVPADRDDVTGEFYVTFNWDAMPGLTAEDLIQGVHLPTTSTCLSCHAKAGGGDWTKRGDIGLSSANPTHDEDVHLASVASGGAGLQCADCHTPVTHQIPGRGIDLRPEEGGPVKACIECHAGKDAPGGHEAAGRHTARVACQSCHIPAFAKGGATEMWRDWKTPHWNPALCGGQGAWAGEEHKVADVAPDHVFFDGTSYVYGLDQTLSQVDPISGFVTVADANGHVNDAVGVSKLVPVKRHQSNMAVMSSGVDTGKVIPFDVVWQFKTGLFDEAAERGKAYAGYAGSHEWKWLEAEMAINHGVSPADNVAECTSCHHAKGDFSVETESKLDKLGYRLKDADKNGVVDGADAAIICSQCHGDKSFKRDWQQMHAHTDKGSGIGCTFCHDIDRPERGLSEPCNSDGTENSAAINEFVENNYYDHCTP
ncbi:MAG: cytochrome c3 family protein [Desulfurivibrionaceae bacterium]|nr:cytochrome c3 family protein [Desulfurivibrionaceae bacterium]